VSSDTEEATITSKGQITIPSRIRAELDMKPGDRVRFSRAADGKFSIETRKRRSILDYVQKNPIRSKEPIKDLDAMIEAATLIAMDDQERRVRRKHRS
jgi:antitoxin PrlF